METDRNDNGQYLAFGFRLQGEKHFLCLLHMGLQSLGPLCQSNTLASGDIDFCLFGIDLGGPWLQFLLDFVMENLGLV